MNPTLKSKLSLAFGAVTVVFLLNAMWLSLLTRSGRSQLHASPIYPTYIAFRKLLLEPITLTMFAVALSLWLLIIYRNSMKKPLPDRAKVGVLVVLASVLYGMILLAYFPL
jgi:hypothetical protein